MKNSTQDDLEYCKNLIRIAANEKLLQLAFLPQDLRTKALAYYGLEAELRHIHQHVSEEMIGHIRYAWWREEMDKLGGAHQQHPVLKSLAQSGIAREQIIALVDVYREAYPQMPQHVPALAIDHAKFNKAGRIIREHKGARWRLLIKLLFV